ncbi:hypothetical protein SO802_033950 [Lithocarpus litseifolius]|uniref:Secreted protein n=1 Tax=Lithocarpus litseifolius TaxID=425828 RepID=A0AAW2BEI0_9ROSI
MLTVTLWMMQQAHLCAIVGLIMRLCSTLEAALSFGITDTSLEASMGRRKRPSALVYVGEGSSHRRQRVEAQDEEAHGRQRVETEVPQTHGRQRVEAQDEEAHGRQRVETEVPQTHGRQRVEAQDEEAHISQEARPVASDDDET